MLKHLFLGGLALCLGLALTSQASAQGFGPRPGFGGFGPRPPFGVSRFPARPYYTQAGVRFAGGYYYPGKHHNHWGGRVWNAQFGRYHYWDPYLKCYYYWHQPRGCFLPIGVAMPF